MTASEFAFLALGLLLGVASGMALVVVLRARPPATREVRLTITPDAIPRRRPATLADGAFGPARGGPGDRRGYEIAELEAAAAGQRRTLVHYEPEPLAFTAYRAPAGGAIALPIGTGRDPMLEAIRTGTALVASATRRVESRDRTSGATAIKVLAIGESGAPSANVDPITPTEASATMPVESGPCADLRRSAVERCDLAVHARSRADEARTTLRIAQRAYDYHVARSEEAALASDPRHVRATKEEIHAAFRAARSRAVTTDEADAAARAWLLEINRINNETRDAGLITTREGEAARIIGATLERLTVETDAARISAESADAACLGAREAAAACEEQRAQDHDAAGQADDSAPPARSGPWSVSDDILPDRIAAGDGPRIHRILRGDHAAMLNLVERLADGDATERRRWQLAISDLVDAILATAIEASSLDFPEDHPFWGPFSRSQGREIASALSALGYRFDGLGGWVDERIPSQRDMSLALGYAGLDPMRVRNWPTEAEMAELLRPVRVAAGDYLAEAAGGLSLGELVTMLGRRADGLADVWNAWGRIRPLLLEDD